MKLKANTIYYDKHHIEICRVDNSGVMHMAFPGHFASDYNPPATAEHVVLEDFDWDDVFNQCEQKMRFAMLVFRSHVEAFHKE
jgi:hypothetical protein